MKKIILSLSIVFLTLGSYAQRHEIGPFIGMNYYLGDLVENNFFTTPRYNIGLNYRYVLSPRFAIKIAGHYGEIAGYSENNKETLRYKNLHFESYLFDIEAGLEINFLEYMPGSMKHRFTPYVFGGISYFRFNPKAEYDGVWYELQPMGTEGQGLTDDAENKYYKLSSFAIPFGIGFKFNVSRTVSIGLEWGMRKTFTDYLDDVSTRYPDIELLRAEKGAVASALSNRIYEERAIENGLDISIGDNGYPNNPGDFNAYSEMQKTYGRAQRGNSESKDWYGIAGITVMFKIKDPKKKKCPAYRNQRNYKEYQ